MVSKTFVVKLSTIAGDSDMLTAQNLESLIASAVQRDGTVGWYTGVESVERFDPENDQGRSKIAAIKRLRALFDGMGLADSKFLCDTAEKLGEAKWGNVVIKFDSVSEYGKGPFKVIDNRG